MSKYAWHAVNFDIAVWRKVPCIALLPNLFAMATVHTSEAVELMGCSCSAHELISTGTLRPAPCIHVS